MLISSIWCQLGQSTDVRDEFEILSPYDTFQCYNEKEIDRYCIVIC